MRWINIASTGLVPTDRRKILCFCPGWCSTDYQVAYYNGKEFVYDEQPNEMFNEHVTDWALFMVAD